MGFYGIAFRRGQTEVRIELQQPKQLCCMVTAEFSCNSSFLGEEVVPVPLEQVAGKKKLVPIDHPLVESARLVGTCFGD